MRLPNKLEELRFSIEDVCLMSSNADSKVLMAVDSVSRTVLTRVNPIRSLVKREVFDIPIGMNPTRFGQ